MPNIDGYKYGYDENELAQARELGYDIEEYDRAAEWTEREAQHCYSSLAHVTYLRG